MEPETRKQDDGLDVEGEQEEATSEDDDEASRVRFNPDMRLKKCPEEGIRAFTKKEKRTHLPAYRQKGRGPRNSAEVTIAGMVAGVRSDETRCGAGAFFERRDNRNTQMRVSGDKARGADRAIVAMIGKIARTIDLNTELSIRIGSKRVHKMLTSKLEKFEDIGFIDVPEGDVVQSALAALRRRGAAIWLEVVPNPGADGPMREAQRLASKGCEAARVDKDELKLEPRFARTGIKLNKGTQNLLYKLILSRKKSAPRRSTAMQIDIVLGLGSSPGHVRGDAWRKSRWTCVGASVGCVWRRYWS
jgi:hypothetical protein